MRTLLTLCFFIMALATTAAHADDNPFIGVIESGSLLGEYETFATAYDDFTPSDDELAQMHKLTGKSVLVLFGTWCHDSEREVPRLLKLLALSKVELAQLELVAVDYNKQDDKGLAELFKLKYTPTFIVLDGETELLRVVEKPEGSLAGALTDFN
ncbi:MULTISPECIES: TlpA family protein disulfide reductase [unclassified Pseudoalteromonas]|uniref:TlpA family protein disulfide reductase n=1 Tax=unclassified Pseudoalteromonas TaxID=194690 RepID=UPI000CF6304E|nr:MULTISPECIES: thioredoxin family protein [unclassified Pseudoalteromonas]MBS3798503.1 thioredoxin family protein [Pseudoalteromonas sp. BDTF-M6]